MDRGILAEEWVGCNEVEEEVGSVVAVRSESVLRLVTLLYSNPGAESDEEDDVMAVVETVLRLVLLAED